MILKGARRFDIDRARSWMIGDSLTDIEAGERAGLRTIWLPQKGKILSPGDPQPDEICDGLYDAARHILGRDHQDLR